MCVLLTTQTTVHSSRLRRLNMRFLSSIPFFSQSFSRVPISVCILSIRYSVNLLSRLSSWLNLRFIIHRLSRYIKVYVKRLRFHELLQVLQQLTEEDVLGYVPVLRNFLQVFFKIVLGSGGQSFCNFSYHRTVVKIIHNLVFLSKIFQIL